MSYRKPDWFNLIIFTIIAVAVMYFAGIFKKADAGEATLTWTHPTQYVDATPLPLANIARTEIQYAKCNAARTGFLSGATPVIGSVAPPPATGTIAGLTAGTWCFRARTVTTASESSVWSGFVSTVIVDDPVPAIPTPPTDLTVNPTVRTAYSLVKRVDRLVLAAVGTVAPGTACVPTQQVNGYFVVPRSSVIWSGSVKPDVVVATCI